MRGILVFNGARPDIAFYDGTLLGGLHCGDRFSFYQEEEQKQVRVESLNDWIMVDNGKPCPLPYGIEVFLPE